MKRTLTNLKAHHLFYLVLVAVVLLGCDNDDSLDRKIVTDENGQRYLLKETIGDSYLIDREVIEIRATDTIYVWKAK